MDKKSNGHYTYEIELIDKEFRTIKDFSTADSAIEAINLIKKHYGEGWIVNKIELICAN